MGLAELTQSKGWKAFMAKLYGIGASVVIVGALFKIMHWPGAGPMLILGLGTEAVIFLFSAFEPLHDEIDWSLVYPQLAGLEPEPDEPKPIGKGHTGPSALEKFDSMLEKAEITPQIFEKLGQGLHNLSKATSNITDISDATVATKDYAGNMKKASESVTLLSDSANSLSDTYLQTADKISTSSSKFVTSVNESATQLTSKVNKSTEEIISSYKTFADSMSNNYKAVAKYNDNYSEQLVSLNKNLAALNAVYELQLQSTNDSLQSSQELYSGLDQMMLNLKDTVEESEKYRHEVSKLGQKLEALNTVYGNMLAAMNVKL